MGQGVKLLVYGDYASFARPKLMVERVAYDMMTSICGAGKP